MGKSTFVFSPPFRLSDEKRSSTRQGGRDARQIQVPLMAPQRSGRQPIFGLHADSTGVVSRETRHSYPAHALQRRNAQESQTARELHQGQLGRKNRRTDLRPE